MIDLPAFCQFLKKELAKDLPGKAYQDRMASSHRNDVKKNTEVPKKGGVLLLVYPFNSQISIVLIKRALSNCPHSGQISFPGGKFEEKDSILVNTALRETDEEIGVMAEDIQILGALTTLFVPVSNFMVFPFVGYQLSKPFFIPNPDEVQSVIEIPFNKLMDPNNVSSVTIQHNNQGIEAPCFAIDTYKIWGATAMILSEFIEIVQRTGIYSFKNFQ